MGKHFRFGICASLALHALPLGMWLTQPPQLIGPQFVNAERKVMEVHFRPSNIVGGTEFQENGMTEENLGTAVTSSAEQTSVTAEENATVPQAAPLQDFNSVFLPKELPYIPAGELDTRPSPEQPVVIPFPDAPLNVPKVTGVLVLYIGSDGNVDRVEIDESNFPREFEKAAIETFLKVRMTPGVLNGQATRARMKILVEFEQH
jgi:TonB family protein